MTRRAFRARVEAPRPASAWVLVTVASAMLWITQQLEPWAIAIQVAALVISLWRRLDPFPWQRNPIALNLAMCGITAGTIAVALRGEPSTVALAHFAALTQVLQLVDTRPRRTEFLLVALALFQAVLAANLTDSVFFTPLLVAFVFAAVWTLLVHTLRSEAIEAGDSSCVDRTLTPGLLRTTLLASSLSVLLALVLFVALPRLRSSVLTATGRGSLLATAGFSERVALGELGRIRQDATVVLRVETLDGEPSLAGVAYWRGLAFDAFDGTTWSVTPVGTTLVPGSAEAGVTLGSRPREVTLVQRIVREPVEGGVLFAAGEVRRLQGTVRHLERDASGGLYAARQGNERVRYTVASYRRTWRDRELRRDRAHPPPREGARYLELPELSEATWELARGIAKDAEHDVDRVRAIERHLLRHGRYSDTPPAIDAAEGRSPIEGFLFGDMAGHCEYFASSMVVLLRALRIPARLVNGFAGGRENRIGDFVEVTRADAHAWVEVHYEKAGWVRYDPTPPDLRARPVAALSLAVRLRDLGSALELWWFRRVVGFDRADQVRALKRAWLAWKGRPRAHRTLRPARDSVPGAWRERTAWLVGGVAGAALFAGLARAARRRRRASSPLPPTYEKALRLLARRRLVRPAAATAREFAEAVREALPQAGAAFSTLTESYLAERFGGRPSPTAAAELRALHEHLRRNSRKA